MAISFFFDDIKDPRGANVLHSLTDILFIALAATLCGGQTCTDFADFAQARLRTLQQVLKLPHGPPSHDTFSRVFRLLDPEIFGRAFVRFTAAFAEAVGQEQVVAFDGKALRRCYERGKQHMPPIMVSAWGTQTRLSLASQLATGGNEAQTVVDMLGSFDLAGCTVTADALHCHRAMAAAVLDAKGDYALVVKGNQPLLRLDAEVAIKRRTQRATASTREINAGRDERRKLTIVATPDMAERHRFPGLVAIARLVSKRGTAKPQTRYFLLSRVYDPKDLLKIIRSHWGIENQLHWVLDVVLGEDQLRVRKDHGPENLALLHRSALNIARNKPEKSVSMRRKFKKAGWDDDYLFSLCSYLR
jgi:predicted transposase YbfD/YdcC